MSMRAALAVCVGLQSQAAARDAVGVGSGPVRVDPGSLHVDQHHAGWRARRLKPLAVVLDLEGERARGVRHPPRLLSWVLVKVVP